VTCEKFYGCMLRLSYFRFFIFFGYGYDGKEEVNVLRVPERLRGKATLNATS